MDNILPFALGIGMCLVQFLAALPWLAVLDWPTFKASLRNPAHLGAAVVGVVIAGVLLSVLLGSLEDPGTLLLMGRLYGALLNIQLLLDFFVLIFAVLLLCWPKGAAVALASFRAGLRQPMFWLLGNAALFLPPFGIILSLIIPYFTFGEDAKMVKEVGYDAIMLTAVIFSIFTAAMTISEEIEGRTAITLMSKPLSRRQFLIGKFAGIFLAALVLSGSLMWFFNWVIWLKPIYDPIHGGDPPPLPAWVAATQQQWHGSGCESVINLALGSALWLTEAAQLLPGIILGLCQVSVLLGVAVALATRLPMVVTLVTCLVVFVLGHLTHVLVQVSEDPDKSKFINVMARVFDTILPGLELCNLGPVIARDIPPPPVDFALHVGSIAGYAAMYTVIALLFGLILFEDRDLA